MNMSYILFLDDERELETILHAGYRKSVGLPQIPAEVNDLLYQLLPNVVVARNFQEAKNAIEMNGYPTLLLLDPDLGPHSEGDGIDFVEWLVEYSMDNDPLPEDLVSYAHSANPIGRENMIAYLWSYLWSYLKSLKD
jgi:hypothetical protein